MNGFSDIDIEIQDYARAYGQSLWDEMADTDAEVEALAAEMAVGEDSPTLPAWGCVACGGYGYHTKASATFRGVTFRVNCRACKGKGFTPLAATARKVAA